MKISECVTKSRGRVVFDSRGLPTTEVELGTDRVLVIASCPSGASTGSQEALELRDGDPAVCRGKGVSNALASIRNILEEILGSNLSVDDQEGIDSLLCSLDGTHNKSKLGANAILPVSLAFCRLSAALARRQLWRRIGDMYGVKDAKMPRIFFNVINGGAHADTGLFAQEIMVSFNGRTPLEVLYSASLFRMHLKDIVKKKYGATGVGDEGGFAPPIRSLEEALDLIEEAEKAAGTELEIALDIAASEFYTGQGYNLGWKKNSEEISSAEELSRYYKSILQRYKISLLEDPFAEKDYTAWQNFYPLAQECKVKVVGDDLLVTNPKLIREAAEKKYCHTALIKMNQIGTLSETLQAVREARNNGMDVMVSHRSGETEDVFLSHLAVGVSAEYVKSGSLCRSERVAKYNELIRIFE